MAAAQPDHTRSPLAMLMAAAPSRVDDAPDPRLVARVLSVYRRVEFIDGLWRDDAAFERIMKSGRYLKLCDATERSIATAEEARRRLLR